LEATPTTKLASAFAGIAAYLYAADSFDDVLLRIAQTAVSTVAGCQMASITVSEHGAYRTAATTDAAASAGDQAPYDAGPGPCLDAVDTHLVYAQSFPDTRWPTLASRPADLGAQSAASYSLAGASLTTAGIGGSLNTYGIEPDAYSEEAQQIGLILAAHASTAAGAVRERGALQAAAQSLNEALRSRDVIGQAKGILMERLKMTPEDAFDRPAAGIQPAQQEAPRRGPHLDRNRCARRRRQTAPSYTALSRPGTRGSGRPRHGLFVALTERDRSYLTAPIEWGYQPSNVERLIMAKRPRPAPPSRSRPTAPPSRSGAARPYGAPFRTPVMTSSLATS
jgi:hypothetical protein